MTTEETTATEVVEEASTEVPETDTTEQVEVEKTVEEEINELLKRKGGLKRKVNGKEREFKSFEEMFKHASLDISAAERFEEAKQMKSQAEKQMEAYKSGDLVSFLKKQYGDITSEDAKTALEETVKMLLDEEAIDPKDKKIRDYEKQIKEIERKEAEQKKRKEDEIKNANLSAEANKILEEVTTSAKKLGLHDDPLLLEQVFGELTIAAQNDTDMTADEAVRIVRDRTIEVSVNFIKALDVDMIEQVLGADLVKQIRGRGVAEAKKSEKAFDTPKKDSKQPDDSEAKTVKTVDLSSKGKYAHMFS